MAITKNIRSILRDASLVRITLMDAFTLADIEKMRAFGWEQVPVTRISTLSAIVGYPSLEGEGAYFRKDGHSQGSAEWYKDLAKTRYADHTPGRIPALIGYNCSN